MIWLAPYRAVRRLILTISACTIALDSIPLEADSPWDTFEQPHSRAVPVLTVG